LSDDFAAASDDLEPLILGDPPRWPAEWTRAQRDAALVLARGALGRGDAGAEYAAKLLRVATTGWPTPRDAWRRRAASLLVVASLVTGDRRQADRWLSKLHRARPQERQRLLDAARRRIDESSTPAVAADGLLRSVEALSGEADAAPEAEAEALAAVGRGAEALAAYARLAADRPDDRAVQVAYANLLIESERPADREEAVRRWRTIESRSPANTDAWLEARLGRLRSLIAAGQVDDAKKLLALTRLLAPSLGGPERAAEFDAVATRLGE